jgi:phosphoserine phosphatase
MCYAFSWRATMSHREGDHIVKVALFLDVDITLTEDFIQKVYAEELGVEEEYRKLEIGFQAGNMPSATFGAQLTALFASKQFSKKQAGELFDKVKLRQYVDELFALQDFGVSIYLVSSGPNYYIETLAKRNNIPISQTKSSTYYFENEGIISRCNAVDANAKTQFVLLEKDKYDVTIGIGDNDRHDAFVSVCTIAMLTKPQKGASEDFIHVAHFHSVLLLVKNLLDKKAASEADDGVVHFDPMKVTIGQVYRRLSLGLWLMFVGLLITSFSAGYTLHEYLPPPKAAAAQSPQ